MNTYVSCFSRWKKFKQFGKRTTFTRYESVVCTRVLFIIIVPYRKAAKFVSALIKFNFFPLLSFSKFVRICWILVWDFLSHSVYEYTRVCILRVRLCASTVRVYYFLWWFDSYFATALRHLGIFYHLSKNEAESEHSLVLIRPTKNAKVSLISNQIMSINTTRCFRYDRIASYTSHKQQGS